MDRRRWRDPVGDWEELRDEGPYQLRFSATNALFANDDRRACIDGLVSGNVDLIIDGDWTGTPPVTVQLKVVDLATPKSGRDTGSTKDADYTFEWTIKPRTRPHPTSMACDSSNYGSDKEAPEAYDYIMNPVIDPPGRPSYKGQSVLEQFGPITANFNMSDIKDEYLARLTNKGLNTPNQVAQFLCSGGQHGTFVIDETDTIYDIHGGFACPIKPFKEASLKSGIGYTLPQTYSCAGTVIGRYTIRRTYRDGQIFINKSGP